MNTDQNGPGKKDDDQKKSSDKPSSWQDDFEDDDSQLKFFGPDGQRVRPPAQGGGQGRQQQGGQQHGRQGYQSDGGRRDDRTFRSRGQRPSSGGFRPQQDRPQQERPQQERPQQERPQQERPQQGRPQQGRPQQGRPQQGRPQHGRPQHGTSEQRSGDQGGRKRFDPNKKPRFDRGDTHGRQVSGMERPQRHAPKRIPGTTLVKALVSYQWASRKISLAAIESGVVKVNDEVVIHPNAYIRADSDIISVNGMVVHRKTIKPLTIVFNKPHGLIGSKEEFRRTLYSHLTTKRFWYTPSGVLPKSASGIVIVSNDKRHADVRKTTIRLFTQDIWVKLHRKTTAKEVADIRDTLIVMWPDEASIVTVSIGSENSRNMWLKITCKHGTVHDIAIALKKFGLEILSIERRRLGPFSVDTLAMGAWHRLTDQEVVSLDELSTGVKPETTPLSEIWADIAERLYKDSGDQPSSE